MKPRLFPLLVLVLHSVLQVSATANFDYFTNVGQSECANPKTFNASDFGSVLTQDSRQLTFIISLKTKANCTDASAPSLLEIGIKPKDREVVLADATISMDQTFVDMTAFDSNQAHLLSSTPVDENWLRIAFSIDLERGKLSKLSMTQSHYSSVPEVALNYGEDWKFDDTTFFSLGQSDSRASLAVEYTNIIVENRYHSNDSLWALMIGNLNSPQVVSYDFQDSKGDSLKSEAGQKTPFYLGESADDLPDENSATRPAQIETGVQFTKPTQHLIMHNPNLEASKGDNVTPSLLLQGVTVSFWIRADEEPSSTSYILRRKSSEDLDVFALKINKDLKLIGSLSNTVMTITTNPLPLNTWTFVTATYQVYAKDAGRSAAVSIYFWDKLQTPQVIQSIPNGYKEDNKDEIIIGGFVGVISKVSFIDSAQVIIDVASADVSANECLLSAGFNHQTCLVPSCPKGTYTSSGACLSCDAACQTCTGAGSDQCTDSPKSPMGIDNDDDNKGIAIAATVIGLIIIGVTILLIVSKIRSKRSTSKVDYAKVVYRKHVSDESVSNTERV